MSAHVRYRTSLAVLHRSSTSIAVQLGCHPSTGAKWLIDPGPPPVVLEWVDAMAAAVEAIAAPDVAIKVGPRKKSAT